MESWKPFELGTKFHRLVVASVALRAVPRFRAFAALILGHNGACALTRTSSSLPQRYDTHLIMVKLGNVDLFLVIAIVVALVILLIIGFYLLVNYQHPDDKNEAWLPKAVVLFGFCLAGITVLMLPLDVANNEGYSGMCLSMNVYEYDKN